MQLSFQLSLPCHQIPYLYLGNVGGTYLHHQNVVECQADISGGSAGRGGRGERGATGRR